MSITLSNSIISDNRLSIVALSYMATDKNVPKGKLQGCLVGYYDNAVFFTD